LGGDIEAKGDGKFLRTPKTDDKGGVFKRRAKGGGD